MRGDTLLHEIETAQVEKGYMAFWWIGQIGFIYKLAGRIIYIDSYLTNDNARIYPPVLEAELIKNADIVIGSHDHSDHIDHPTWIAIAKSSPQAVFVCPSMHVAYLSEELGIPKDRFYGIEDSETKEIKGISISGIAAAHEKLDQDPKTGAYPYMGYVLRADSVSFYHSGDTCNYEGMETKIKSFGTLDAIFLPINGRDSYRYTHGCMGNMTFQEAVDLTGALCPRLAVPAHYEMHAINLENPEKFEYYLRVKYPGIQCWLGKYGEKITIKGGEGITSHRNW